MARLPFNVLRVRRGGSVKFRIRWTDATGHRRSANFDTADEAKVELATREAEVRIARAATAAGEAPAPPARATVPTVEAFHKTFMTVLRRRQQQAE